MAGGIQSDGRRRVKWNPVWCKGAAARHDACGTHRKTLRRARRPARKLHLLRDPVLREWLLRYLRAPAPRLLRFPDASRHIRLGDDADQSIGSPSEQGGSLQRFSKPVKVCDLNDLRMPPQT